MTALRVAVTDFPGVGVSIAVLNFTSTVVSINVKTTSFVVMWPTVLS
jgi:hypothetical protein